MLKPSFYGTAIGVWLTLAGPAFAKATEKSKPATPMERDSPAWRERVAAELAQIPKPPAPPGPGHPIDAFLTRWFVQNNVAPPAPCDDRAFIRRVHLDLIGLPPSPERLDAFLAATDSHKRSALIDELLADRTACAEHWMTFFNDLLRNDEQTNIDNLRKPITAWLFDALVSNKPYDEMVGELLDPRGGPAEGFLKGVNWRGAINASQTPVIQAAQTSAQVFFAVSLKCASCHDHFIREWTLKDSHGYASFFSAANVEIHRCDHPTGRREPPRFLYQGLGSVAPDADLPTRLAAVSVLATRPKNPRFSKVIVNRIFKRLIGQGLIDRVDDLDYSKAFDPELFDWLADDFMRSGYDLRRLIRLIATSQVYQAVALDGPRAAVSAEKHAEPPFRGPRLRRLTSEQFLDGVSAVTGYWPNEPAMNVEVPNPRLRAWRHKKPSLLAEMLGRPNREQVCSERLDEATILQILEVVNGPTLSGVLTKGVETLLAGPLGKETDVDKTINVLCLRAWGKSARPVDLKVGRELVGQSSESPVKRREGWEDFLWILFASPDFQFID